MISRVKILFLALASTLLVTSCGGGSSGGGDSGGGGGDNPPSGDKTNFDKALLAVSNFDIEKTNGFDYSLKQYLGRDVVNSDSVSLRADFSHDVVAEKTEIKKRLNSYNDEEQFTVTEVKTYYSNNMMCEYKNNQWKWTNCKKSDYFAISISQIKFDKSYLTSVKETLGDKYTVSADVIDSKVKEFFNSESISFNSVSLKLTVSSDFSSFESVELSYFQTNTRSEMKIATYVGEVNIELPE